MIVAGTGVCAVLLLSISVGLLPQDHPEGAAELRARGLAMLAEDRVADALESLERYLTSVPGDREILWKLGMIRYHAEDYGRAEDCFEEILAGGQGAGAESAMFMLGNVAFRRFEFGEAGRRYSDLQKSNPAYPGLAENIALLEARIDRVRVVQKLKLRGDLFFFAIFATAGGILLAAAVREWRRPRTPVAGRHVQS